MRAAPEICTNPERRFDVKEVVHGLCEETSHGSNTVAPGGSLKVPSLLAALGRPLQAPSAQHAGMPSHASHHCHQSCFTFSQSWQPCAQGWTLLRGSGPGATVRAAQLKLCHPKAEPRARLLMESCLPARHTRDERPRRVRRHDLPRARRGASRCLDSVPEVCLELRL